MRGATFPGTYLGCVSGTLYAGQEALFPVVLHPRPRPTSPPEPWKSRSAGSYVLVRHPPFHITAMLASCGKTGPRGLRCWAFRLTLSFTSIFSVARRVRGGHLQGIASTGSTRVPRKEALCPCILRAADLGCCLVSWGRSAVTSVLPARKARCPCC